MERRFYVYILRGDSGRHYIGQTSDLDARLAQHRSGHTHTTARLGGEIELIAAKAFESRAQAMTQERRLKSWKNPTMVIDYLSQG